MQKFDVVIIGGGVAGSFAALRFAEQHKNLKVALIDLGRPPQKRRRQLEAWFGCFPTGDGKIYTTDIDQILNIADGRRAKAINRWFFKQLDEINPTKVVKSKQPSSKTVKKIKDIIYSEGTSFPYSTGLGSIAICFSRCKRIC